MDKSDIYRVDWLLDQTEISARMFGKSTTGMAMAEKIAKVSGSSSSMIIADELPLQSMRENIEAAMQALALDNASKAVQNLATNFGALSSGANETTLSVEKLKEAFEKAQFEKMVTNPIDVSTIHDDMIHMVAFPDPVERFRRSIREQENRRYEEAAQEHARRAQEEQSETEAALSELPTYGMF